MSELPQSLRFPSPAEGQARLAQDRKGAPYLLFRDGDETQQLFSLAGLDLVRIGRQEDEGLELPVLWDGQVSEAHAVLERAGKIWSIRDKKSRNGTFVNSRPVREHQLSDGDVIRLGTTPFVFVTPVKTPRVITDAAAPPPKISFAQRNVLRELVRPMLEDDDVHVTATNAEIAYQIDRGEEVVKTHMSNLFKIFGTDDLAQHYKRTALAEAAIATRAITEEEVATTPAKPPVIPRH